MRINWNEYFMSLAILTSYRSIDPSTKVGAIVIDEDNKIVSLGYNGMPRGIDPINLTWNKNIGSLDNKYLYVCHAELNAILNTRNGNSVKNCTLYVTLFPCNECAKILIQTGIKKVVYLDDKYHDDVQFQASRKLLELAGIECVKYDGRICNLTLE